MNQAPPRSAFDLMKPCIRSMTSCPTLEQLTLNQVTILLWRKYDGDISKYYTEKFIERNAPAAKERWRTIQNSVKANIQSLEIPQKVREELAQVETVIAHQLCNIINIASHYKFISLKKTDQHIGLFWTPRGTIDKQKTIRFLLNNAVTTNDDHRLKMACEFCLEDEVARMWSESTVEVGFKDYWMSFVDGTALNNSVVEECFFKALVDDNDTAITYFWPKMGEERRNRTIGKCFEIQKLWPTVMYFMLTRIPEEKLKSWIEEKLLPILQCVVFACRPWSKHFLSEELFAFLCDDDRTTLFEDVVDSSNFWKFYSVRFFKLVWRTGTVEWKLRVLRDTNNRRHVVNSRYNKKFDILKEMLKVLPVGEKLNFLQSSIPAIFKDICKGRQRLWVDFIEEYTKDVEDVTSFKRQLAECGMRNVIRLITKNGVEEFFDFCKLPKVEMVQLKRKYCSYDNMVEPLSVFENREIDVGEIEKFCVWCLMSEDEIKHVMERFRSGGS